MIHFALALHFHILSKYLKKIQALLKDFVKIYDEVHSRGTGEETGKTEAFADKLSFIWNVLLMQSDLGAQHDLSELASGALGVHSKNMYLTSGSVCIWKGRGCR